MHGLSVKQLRNRRKKTREIRLVQLFARVARTMVDSERGGGVVDEVPRVASIALRGFRVRWREQFTCF